jgi:hypothetical protein
MTITLNRFPGVRIFRSVSKAGGIKPEFLADGPSNDGCPIQSAGGPAYAPLIILEGAPSKLRLGGGVRWLHLAVGFKHTEPSPRDIQSLHSAIEWGHDAADASQNKSCSPEQDLHTREARSPSPLFTDHIPS